VGGQIVWTITNNCINPIMHNNTLQGEHTLRTEDILAKIEEEGDSIALVLFSGKLTDKYLFWLNIPFE